MNDQRFQEIRDTDAVAGDDLQLCPQAWQHRRELLEYIAGLHDDREAQRLLVLELSRLLEPFTAGAMDLSEIVGRMKATQALPAWVGYQPAIAPCCPHGYRVAELNDGTVICEVCAT